MAEKHLSSAQRAAIPSDEYAIPEIAPKPGSYPIPDMAHAHAALMLSAGKPEAARVRAAVYRRFPMMKG